MKKFTEAQASVWAAWIGRKVIKRTGKPFKSGRKIGTVVAMHTHTHTEQLAFTFAEDDSSVECFRCELVQDHEASMAT